MIKRKVESDLLDRLDRYVANGGKIPATNDLKVNVSGLCRELGAAPSDAQHFYRKEELKLAVNALAEEQGLAPIGARAQSVEDQVVQNRIASVAAQAKVDAMAAAESLASAKVLLDELRAAQSEIRRLILENKSLRTRLAIIEGGGVVPRI